MRNDRPSDTATWLAYARMLAERRKAIGGFSDPVSNRMLPPGVLSSFAPRAVLTRVLGRALEGDVALRTVVIDEALRSAIPPQLVVLGAGLDARAWRLKELSSTLVFDVDRPATQAPKRSRAAELKPLARDVRFVPANFEIDPLDARLAAAGHEASVRTFWICDGVVEYLSREATRAMLRAVAARSAPGSRLAVAYAHMMPGQVAPKILTGLVGEPHRVYYAPEQMAAELTSAGLRILTDSKIQEWAARFGISVPWPFNRSGGAHLVVAEKA